MKYSSILCLVLVLFTSVCLAAGQKPLPVSWPALLNMVLREVPQQQIVADVNEKGIGFKPGLHLVEPLQMAGAGESLVTAIGHARYYEHSDFEPQEPRLAESRVRELLAAKPKSSLLRYLLGVLRIYQGDDDGAIRELRESIRLDPSNWHAHFDLATSLQARFPPDRKGVVAEFRRVTELKPDWAGGYVALGTALVHRFDTDGMLAAFRTAARLEPGNPDHRISIADTLKDKGDLDAAHAECLEALRLQPGYDEAIWALYRTAMARSEHDVNGAIAAYREILQLAPKHYSSHYRLAELYATKGDSEASLDSLRQACALHPDDSSFKVKCAALGKTNLPK